MELTINLHLIYRMDLMTKNEKILKSNSNKKTLINGVSPITSLALGLQGTSFKNKENVAALKNLDFQEGKCVVKNLYIFFY